VAQEALTNVARHAQATGVTIKISQVAGTVRMEIRDNGRSFAVKKVLESKHPKRLGLVGMKERVEMVGGTLAIASSPGKGTVVRVEIPSPKKTA
jgi:signal transduction histidine kinase